MGELPEEEGITFSKTENCPNLKKEMLQEKKNSYTCLNYAFIREKTKRKNVSQEILIGVLFLISLDIMYCIKLYFIPDQYLFYFFQIIIAKT